MSKEQLIEKVKEIIKPYTTNNEAYENLTEDLFVFSCDKLSE